MQRIGTPDGNFHPGDPSAGIKGTVVTQPFMQAVQEELAAIPESVGMKLDAKDNKQILQAIQQMIGDGTKDITGKVSKAGDMMTGPLSVPNLRLNQGMSDDDAGAVIYNNPGERGIVFRVGAPGAYKDSSINGNGTLSLPARPTWGATPWDTGNFDPNTKISRSGDTMKGTLKFGSNYGENSIGPGNGDGASYEKYNIRIGAWFGIGITDNNGVANGYYDSRAGKWDCKGGFFVDGARVWDPSNFDPKSLLPVNGRAYSSARLFFGGTDSVFNWSGQGGQPQWLWGGSDPANMYVYNPANFNVNYANSAGNVNGVNDPAWRGDACSWRTVPQDFGRGGVGTSAGAALPAPYVMCGLYQVGDLRDIRRMGVALSNS